MTVEWTLEQQARFPPETRVLLDMFLERGGVEVLQDHDCTALLLLAGRKVHPYEMRTRDGSLFGFGPAPDLSAPAVVKPLTTEAVAGALRTWIHRTCPLAGCEAFDFVQREVPASIARALSRIESGTVGSVGGITTIDLGRRTITVSSADERAPEHRVPRGLDRRESFTGSRIPWAFVPHRLDGRRRA